MFKETRKAKSVSEEKGGILIFICLALVAVACFLVLSIDLSRVSSSVTEKLFTSDHLAVAALQTYIEFEPTDSEIGPAPGGYTGTMLADWINQRRHQLKLQKAYTRINVIGNRNSRTDKFGAPQVDGTGTDFQLGYYPTSNERAGIVAGRWWIYRPDWCGTDAAAAAAYPCPCSLVAPEDPGKSSCFEPCYGLTGCTDLMGHAPKPFANAVHVVLGTKTSDAADDVGMFFSRAAGFGVDSMPVKSGSVSAGGSVAATSFKRGIILMDLGRGMTVDSTGANAYLPFERAAPGVREYSYRLTGNPGVCTSAANPTVSSATIYDTSADANERGYKGSYTGTAAHYGDYGCYPEMRNGVLEFHLVSIRGADPLPEPYWTLMTTANSALQAFRRIGAGGDAVGFLGMDLNFAPERFITPVGTTDPDFDRMLDITSNPDIAAQNFMFPTAFAKSDLPQAIAKAAQLLNMDKDLYKVEPFIILFSNGLTARDRTPGPSIEGRQFAPKGASSYVESKTFNFHATSQSEMFSSVLTNLIPSGIKLHVIAAGARSGSHAALVRSIDKPGTCMKEDELRKRGYLGFLPENNPAAQMDAFLKLGDPGVNPYFGGIGQLYSLAVAGTGEFISVRPQCAFPIAAGGSYANIDLFCASRGILPSASTGDAIADTLASTAKPTVPGPVIDASGRLYCDPDPQTDPIARSDTMFRDLIEKRPVMLVAPD